MTIIDASLFGATDASNLIALTPFSFTYDGKPADLRAWQQSKTLEQASGGKSTSTTTYKDPDTGLEVRCVATQFAGFPAAVEWVLTFRNTGSSNTPIISDIRALDLDLQIPSGADVTLHRLHGSYCNETDFLPIDDVIKPGESIDSNADGGRSSCGQFPFFNLEWNGGGLVCAIGWTGQWALHVSRDDKKVSVLAGQKTTHFTLYPGEEIRTPRMLIVSWQGADRFEGHNILRRLMLDRYIPHANGKPVFAPVTEITWFTYNEGNETTEENQLAAMKSMADAGLEGYWLDAGWFEGGWPLGAGSWVPKKEAFPNGLRPLGDAAHALGLKFVLWFEPERVTANSRVAIEHPEWVMPNPNGGECGNIFDLGNPDAAAWLTDYLATCLIEWDVDVFRNDFNIDPMPSWLAADAPDRQGISEIRYIEALYRMWDELIARKPGLLIDNCASGGRRIDLETMSRSIPLWQSDTQCCGKDMPVWNQVQNASLSQYVPIHSAGAWSFDPYDFRSIATTGLSVCSNLVDRERNAGAKEMIQEAKSLREMYVGDYYPLTSIGLDETQWCGWQYDRPEIGKGFVMCFRRSESPYAAIEVGLRGLDPEANYSITDVDSAGKLSATGAMLRKSLNIAIANKPGCALLIYEKM